MKCLKCGGQLKAIQKPIVECVNCGQRFIRTPKNELLIEENKS